MQPQATRVPPTSAGDRAPTQPNRIHRGTSAAAVLDFLETFAGQWWTIENICDHLDRYRPENVTRSTQRLAARGLIHTRPAPPGEQVSSRAPIQYRIPHRGWLDGLWQ